MAKPGDKRSMKPQQKIAAGQGEQPGRAPVQPDRMQGQKQDAGLPEDLIFGAHPVREALRRGSPLSRVWLSQEKKDRVIDEITSHCRKANIPFRAVDKAFLDRLCGSGRHQGVAAQTAPKEYTSWRMMQQLAEGAGQAPVIVVLDGVEDPQNLGAVLRSIEAMGAHGAVIAKHRAAPLTSGVARASAGAWEYVMVDRVTNLSSAVEEMKKAGFWVVGATADAGTAYYDIDWTIPVALVLGGESKGLSPLMRKKCDMLAGIPMEGKINSLNVSAAAAVILSEMNHQRRGQAALR